MMSREAFLHGMVCDYLRLQYPNVIFRTDFAAGIKMTIGQATKHKRLQYGRAWPDLFIAEPRMKFHGLFVELKAEGTRIYKKNLMYASEHIIEQAEMMNLLEERGYFASFAVGFEEAKAVIDGYLAQT